MFHSPACFPVLQLAEVAFLSSKILQYNVFALKKGCFEFYIDESYPIVNKNNHSHIF